MPKPIRLSTENFLVFLVLVFAAAMRLWNIESWSFTNDELSALSRLRFDTLGELFQEGISVDAHPAGHQLILYVWTSLFGTSEIAVRLPSVIFGILSTYGIYQIGRIWIHKHAGLIAATLFAGLGFTITYTVLARPYAGGILAVVWSLLFLSKLVRGRPSIPFWSYIGLSFSIALGAYFHYWSGATVFLLYILGLFLLKKGQFKPYLFAGLFGLLLFTPHITIFLKQFKNTQGGLGWLDAPTPDVFSDFLSYAFNETWIIATLLGMFLVIRIIAFRDQKFSSLGIVGLLLFASSFMAAYTYSIYQTPLLQFSILSFAFSGLLLCIGDLTYFPGVKTHVLQIVVLMSLLTLTTVITNDYRIESRFGTFKHIAEHLTEWEQKYPETKHIVAINSDRYLQHYLDKVDPDIEFTNLKMKYTEEGEQELSQLAEILDQNSLRSVTYSTSSMNTRFEAKELVRAYFPFTVDENKSFNSSTALFIKGNDNGTYLGRMSIPQFGSSTDQYMMHTNFKWNELRVTKDPEKCLLAVSGLSEVSDRDNVVLVIEIKREGKPLEIDGEPFWTGRNIQTYISESGTWFPCVSVIELPEELIGSDEISVYIYNPNQLEVGFRSYEVKVLDK